MKLSEALREAADQVAGYDVLDRAIVQGRRRRRWSTVAAATAVVVVVTLAAAVTVPWLIRDDGVAEPPPAPTIPQHIGPPGLFTPDAATSPAGPASLIFSGGGGDLVVVGAAQDTYRVIDTDADAGWNALLSPTGDRIAYASGAREVRVVDLVHGGARSYGPGADSVDTFAPEAWLPDGTGLVVMSRTEADDPTTQGIVTQLSIMDLATGALDPFAEATWTIATPGFAVAVSPDGSRIAYQYSNFVSVFDRNTGEKTRFDLDSYFVLAGRSAWAPDGSLALLHGIWQAGRTWQLLLVDPADGTARRIVATVQGRELVRLIGWSGATPVLVSYDDGECPSMFPGYVLFRDTTCTVGVSLFGDTERTLVQPVRGVFFIDIAESLLTDPQTRTGEPPWRPTWTMALAPLLLTGLAALGIYQWRRRISRRAAGRGRP